MPNPFKELAEYFSGAVVAHNSVLLSTGAPYSTMAKKFFALRKAFDIEGYDDYDTALSKIKTAIEEHTP